MLRLSRWCLCLNVRFFYDADKKKTHYVIFLTFFVLGVSVFVCFWCCKQIVLIFRDYSYYLQLFYWDLVQQTNVNFCTVIKWKEDVRSFWRIFFNSGKHGAVIFIHAFWVNILWIFLRKVTAANRPITSFARTKNRIVFLFAILLSNKGSNSPRLDLCSSSRATMESLAVFLINCLLA